MSNELDFSKPEELQTRDGRAVRIYATDGGGVYPIHGAVKDGGQWQNKAWTENGKFYPSGDCGADLVRKPRRVTGWVNVYKRSDVFSVLGQDVHDSRDLAKMAGRSVAQGQIYIDAEIQT